LLKFGKYSIIQHSWKNKKNIGGVEMISTSNVTLRFGKRTLFEDVNLKFTAGNCYGIIGANGAGKTTFLKVLSGEIEPSEGEVVISKNERLSVLKQNHYEYDEFKVLDTVIMGNIKLYNIMKQRDEIYSKSEFTDADGIKAGELEAEFAELDGWNAETDAAQLLEGLGVPTTLHNEYMKNLKAVEKVKVLLAQALFGKPDILLLDEPTNHLDVKAIAWLDNFLIDFENTVIVVSHDRHFLNKVCTHIADVDYGKIQIYPGNYDFWYESSQLALKQTKESNKKKEDKIKELQEFIQRFSANASKSKQATSRKKLLDKIELDEIKPSTRRYPYVDFKIERELGNEVLEVSKLSKTVENKKVLNNVSFKVLKDDKIAFIGNEIAITTLFKILMDEVSADNGQINWGITTSKSYFPKDNTKYFEEEKNLVEWLMEYSPEKTETFVRGFLGRMLFSGEEALKNANVISGGEKVRCMLAKMMLSSANVIILDEPTNHLDLESITSVNNGVMSFKGVVLFVSKDHEFVNSIANRIIEIKEDGSIIDKRLTYDEYLNINN
jgi:ATPase subunit of ABC transporter with duplicated ATPase domains